MGISILGRHRARATALLVTRSLRASLHKERYLEVRSKSREVSQKIFRGTVRYAVPHIWRILALFDVISRRPSKYAELRKIRQNSFGRTSKSAKTYLTVPLNFFVRTSPTRGVLHRTSGDIYSNKGF